MKGLAILLGSIALVACPFASAQAGDRLSDVPQAQLDRMGFPGARPLSDAEGHQVRGNWAAGRSAYVGIPLQSVGGPNLVIPVNRPRYSGFGIISAVILRHTPGARSSAEPIPPGRLDD